MMRNVNDIRDRIVEKKLHLGLLQFCIQSRVADDTPIFADLIDPSKKWQLDFKIAFNLSALYSKLLHQITLKFSNIPNPPSSKRLHSNHRKRARRVNVEA
jgi:hypothetical protein